MLEFIPRAELKSRLRAGWQLLPGHEYDTSDWAILMVLHEGAPRPSPEKLDRIMMPWIIRDRIISTRRAGGISGNIKRAHWRAARDAKRAARMLLEYA